MTAGDLLWTPTPAGVEAAEVTRFARFVEQRHGLRLDGYHALHAWSVRELEAFWAAIWDFFEVRSSAPYERILGSQAMPGAEWFPGARLSYAEHVLRDRGDADVAIVGVAEGEPRRQVTWAELRAQTAALQSWLRAAGVGPGDRVAAVLPNRPETVAAFLACASIGAVWSSCAPEFGVQAVVDRFAQIGPKVLLCVDGYRYGGKEHGRLDMAAALLERLPTVERTLVLPVLSPAPAVSALRGAALWDDALAAGAGANLSFAQLPFAHPLWVLYSSGTTGLPKPIVHGQGGILLEHLKSGVLLVDLHPGDRFAWYTTTGWMMWNFMVGGLLAGASIVTIDGNPAWPEPGALWSIAADTGVTCLGTSPAYVGACTKAGVEPRAGRDLSALRAVGCTGSPLSPEGFRWLQERLGAETWIFSTSGGTDICTSLVVGVPTLPAYEGELQGPALGADVQAWDADGRPVGVDEVGELVIVQPLPSMPVGFWNDPDGSRYRASYFEHYPGVWRHGDWIRFTPHGGAVISGRSDSTINRAGVRMGTAEIYRVVLQLPELVDAVVVDLPRPGTDGYIALFVVLREGATLDDTLRDTIRRRLREDCSPRHVPDEITQIAEVPRTLSGKVLEVPVKRILMGEPPERAASRESLANPAALDWFVARASATR